MKIYLRAACGDQFYIHENGDIQRLDMYPSHESFTGSGQWKMLGIGHVKRNQFIPLSQLFKELPGELDGSSLTYKNGKPQWTVRDLDHGTTRVWGNTEFHGIRELRRIT